MRRLELLAHDAFEVQLRRRLQDYGRVSIGPARQLDCATGGIGGQHIERFAPFDVGPPRDVLAVEL
jgi:hypothetical protein